MQNTKFNYFVLCLGLSLAACGKHVKKLDPKSPTSLEKADLSGGAGGISAGLADAGAAAGDVSISENPADVEKVFNKDLSPQNADKSDLSGNWSLLQIRCNGDVVPADKIPANSMHKLTFRNSSVYVATLPKVERKLEACKSESECDLASTTEITENTFTFSESGQYITLKPVKKSSNEDIDGNVNTTNIDLSDAEKAESTFSASIVESTGALVLYRTGSELCKTIKGPGTWIEVQYFRKIK